MILPKSFWRGLLLPLLVAVLSGCGEAPQPALRVGTILWPGYEPIYLARERGLLDADQVVLVEYVNSGDVLRGMLNDVLDIGALTMDEALSLASQRPDEAFVIFHVADISNGGDGILGRPPVTSLSQLQGGRIGYEITALGSYFLDRALASADLARDQITTVHIEMDNQLAAWEQGDIDALVTFDPLLTRIRMQGANVLFSSADIPGEIVDLMVVRRSMMRERPDAVAHLLSAWFGAVQYLEDEPVAAQAIIDRRLRLGSEGVRQALAGLRIPGRDEVATMVSGPDPSLKVSLARMQQLMKSAGLIEREVDVDALFSPEIPGLDIQ